MDGDGWEVAFLEELVKLDGALHRLDKDYHLACGGSIVVLLWREVARAGKHRVVHNQIGSYLIEFKRVEQLVELAVLFVLGELHLDQPVRGHESKQAKGDRRRSDRVRKPNGSLAYIMLL